MGAERDARLRELEEQLRLLRSENDLLAEAQTDAVLLGTLADHLARGGEPATILRVALEEISVLKDLPVCAACEERDGGLEVVAAHVAVSHWPLEGASVSLAPAARAALAHGPVLLDGAAAVAALPRAEPLAGFVPAAAVLLPFRPQDRAPGALLFCADTRPGRLQAAIPVLQRAAEAIRVRLDRLALSEALRRLAERLDVQVVERTRELAASETRLRAALEAVSMGTFEWDVETGVVAWSGVDELVGLPPGGLGPALRAYVERVHEADRAEVEAALAAARRAGGAQRVRVEHRVAGARPRVLELHGREVPAGAGGARRIAGVVVDVTERRAMEEDLLQARKMETVGRLAAGIAHDFNNLLTTILGGAEAVLELDGLDASAREDLAAVRGAARRAAELTRRLLDFSRKRPLEVRPLPLHDLATGLAPILQRLMGADVRLALEIESGLPWALGDPAQFEQILVNFAANARDAMPRGGSFTIGLAAAQVPAGSADPAPGAYVRLTVADTGAGMAPDVVSRAFEPFFTTKAPGEGTGLGLAIVYTVVKQLGGAISVESAPGRGTRFDVLFPVVPDEDPEGEADPAPA